MSDVPPTQAPVAVPPATFPAAPVALGYATPGSSGAQLAVWTDGRYVYARDGSRFPPMCVKCGTDAYVTMKAKRFTWFHPLAYLGLLGGIQESGLLFLAAFFLFIASVVGLVINGPIMAVSEIKDGVIKLRRISPEFMKLLSRTP